MNVIITGATGMVGHGVLMEALDSPHVTRVLSIGRKTKDMEHPKLEQLIHTDFENFTPIADKLSGFDACFWCLGTSSAGMDEATYSRITYDFTVAGANVMLEQNPGMRFCFLSGAGADDTLQSRMMWARVKGKAENAMKEMGFKEAIIFRPAMIKAQRGSEPRGVMFKVMYTIMLPLFPLMRKMGQATSCIEIGHAMIAAGMGLSTKTTLDSPDINELAARLPAEAQA